MLTLNCVVQRDSDVIAAEADQDLVMVSIANGFYYGVSDVAREIWEAIEHPKKVSDLVDDLSATYNVDRSRANKQTLSFLQDLLKECLLQVRDGPSSKFWPLTQPEKLFFVKPYILLLLSNLSVKMLAFRHIDSFLRKHLE